MLSRQRLAIQNRDWSQLHRDWEIYLDSWEMAIFANVQLSNMSSIKVIVLDCECGFGPPYHSCPATTVRGTSVRGLKEQECTQTSGTSLFLLSIRPESMTIGSEHGPQEQASSV